MASKQLPLKMISKGKFQKLEEACHPTEAFKGRAVNEGEREYLISRAGGPHAAKRRRS